LSALRSARHELWRDVKVWRQLLALASSQFRKAFDGSVGIVKLSNWPANLLVELCCTSDARSVFLVAGCEDYLVAVLRGGDERARFILRFVQGLRGDFAGVDQAVRVVESTPDLTWWQRVLRCALIALAAQCEIFELVQARAQGRSGLLDGGKLLEQPDQSLAQIGRLLDLPLRRSHRRRAVKNAFSQASKAPWVAFDPSAHASSDQYVR